MTRKNTSSTTLMAALFLTVCFGASVLAESRSLPAPIVTASSDGRAVEVKRANDSEPVRVPVLDRCGNPKVGEPKIRHIAAIKGNVVVTYGKHCSATVS